MALTASETNLREQLVERVRTIAMLLWPGCSIAVFGSWPAGLAAFDSDIDMCVQGGGIGEGALRQLASQLRAASWCRTLNLISAARVPIITLTDAAGIDADICLGGSGGDGVRATAFLQECTRLSPSFAPVVLCLKLLLAQRSLTKTFTGGVSSYKLCVMVRKLLGPIENAQVDWRCKPQAAGHGDERMVQTAPTFESVAALPAGDLLLRVLRHYGTVVDWTTVTSIRVGSFEASFTSQVNMCMCMCACACACACVHVYVMCMCACACTPPSEWTASRPRSHRRHGRCSTWWMRCGTLGMPWARRHRPGCGLSSMGGR